MDQLCKGRIPPLNIAFSYAVTTGLVNDAIRRHDCDPAAAHIFGRALTAALLSAAQLGDGERLNARWKYSGALKTVLVDAGPDGSLRGFIAPTALADVPDADAIYSTGGTVNVVRSRGELILSSGTVEAAIGDVVDDLDYFHAISDQTETGSAAVIAFRADPARPVSLCRGLLLHALPECDLNRFEGVRQKMRSPHFRDFLTRLDETDSHVENLLQLLVERGETGGLHIESIATPEFRCTCSRDKMGAVLRSLSYEERMDIVQKKEPVNVNCRMCNTRYTLSIEDCVRLWNNKPLD